MKKYLAPALLVTLAALSLSCSAPPRSTGGDDTAVKKSITVQATGTVIGTPDVVTLRLGVQTNAVTAAQALADNSTAAGALMDTIKAAGVTDKDVQTSQLSMSPRYDKDGSRVTGYQATNMVSATVRDISKAGALIDAAGKAAGDSVRVDGVSFRIDDTSELMAAARKDAIGKARAQAEQIAQAAGVQLGAVIAISEQGGFGAMPFVAARGEMASSPAPIAPGSKELTLTVSVSYQIR